MKRPRKKPDYKAAILVRDSGVIRKAVIVVVRGNDVYAVQPHTEMKVSYHASGRYHLKVGHASKALIPLQRTPTGCVDKAEDMWGMTMVDFSRMQLYGGERYDRTVLLDIEDLPGRRLSLAFAIGRDFRGWRELYPPDTQGTTVIEHVLRHREPKVRVLTRVKKKSATGQTGAIPEEDGRM